MCANRTRHQPQKRQNPIFDLIEFGNHIRERRLDAGYKTVSDLMAKMGLYKKIKRSNGTEDFYSGTGWFESGKKQPSLQELIRLNQLLKLDSKYYVSPELKNKKLDPKKFNVLFNKTDVCDDVWITPKSEKNRLGHPTQKPLKLFLRIIKASSNEGDIILDPFAGSGTTAEACHILNRRFIGFEISEEYHRIAEVRVGEAMVQRKLFEFGNG